MVAAWRRFDRGVVGQLARYALSGGLVAVLGVGTYSGWAILLDGSPMGANLLAYLVTVTAGFFLHGAVSFGGVAHGPATWAKAGRFVVTSWLSLALNAGFVWLTTDALGWPKWSPLPFMVLVTPLVAFAVLRAFVYRTPVPAGR